MATQVHRNLLENVWAITMSTHGTAPNHPEEWHAAKRRCGARRLTVVRINAVIPSFIFFVCHSKASAEVCAWSNYGARWVFANSSLPPMALDCIKRDKSASCCQKKGYADSKVPPDSTTMEGRKLSDSVSKMGSSEGRFGRL